MKCAMWASMVPFMDSFSLPEYCAARVLDKTRGALGRTAIAYAGGHLGPHLRMRNLIAVGEEVILARLEPERVVPYGRLASTHMST